MPRDKSHLLQDSGCRNRHPDRVQDPLFEQLEFFDPEDLVQVKYEMLRRVQVESDSATRAAAEFGFSRPSFHQAQEHLSRLAFLYVRQSTLQQVVQRGESTRRQYALRERAVALGWQSDQVEVIDSDLGLSGASADRAGFQKLVAAQVVERTVGTSKSIFSSS